MVLENNIGTVPYPDSTDIGTQLATFIAKTSITPRYTTYTYYFPNSSESIFTMKINQLCN